jgi:protein-tyrosine phosphatase
MVALDHLRDQVPPRTAFDPGNAAIRTRPDTKVFVHCACGADRTRVMVAAYRIAIEHETIAADVSEIIASILTAFGIRSLLAT